MQVFYAPDISGNNYTLDEKESKHCIRVLRMAKGEPVRLVDGKGNLYEGVVSQPDSKKCIITVTSHREDFERRGYRLHIAISPLKNPERFEWFVEKSVEIGIDEITPLICKNSEKRKINKERIDNLIISAMKQSVKSLKTVLNDWCCFDDFIGKNFSGNLMIAHCNSSFERRGIAEVCSRGQNPVILVGPEGDFSPEEIGTALKRGYSSVHLGKSRLRTETAGIAACHSIYVLNL
jgi:16S rRNA (uracil1498-N3)-methyltransferase